MTREKTGNALRECRFAFMHRVIHIVSRSDERTSTASIRSAPMDGVPDQRLAKSINEQSKGPYESLPLFP